MGEVAPRSGNDLHDLFVRASALVEAGRETVSRQVNQALAVTFWRLGRLVSEEVMGLDRAAYGEQIVVTLSRQLVERYVRSFEEKNLRRMVQFAQVFPDEVTVA